MERAKRERGRPSGSFRIDPALVPGFVTALRAAGRARNNHAAVDRLSRLGVFTYDQALHGLRAAKKEPRLRPLLLPSRGEAQVSASEAAELLRRAIRPMPGEAVDLRFDPDGVARLINVITEDGEEHPSSQVP